MRDICTESIVTIVPRKQDILIKYILIGMIAVSLVLLFVVGIIGIVSVAAFALLLNRHLVKTDGEYEYVHTNDVFDVDVVVRNSKRKQLTTISLGKVEVVARADSDEVSSYGHLNTIDYSGNQPSGNLYAIIYRENGKPHKMLIQMDNQMRNSLKKWIPQKVH